MDLPERMLTNKVSSRLGNNLITKSGLSRISFKPYSFTQLEEIITSRLEGLAVDIYSDAITFCARAIGGVSGDARRALDLCRYKHHLYIGTPLNRLIVNLDHQLLSNI
jgi:origin recognition complex subunit 1